MLKEEWEISKKSNESVLFHIIQVRERLVEMSELISDNVKWVTEVLEAVI